MSNPPLDRSHYSTLNEVVYLNQASLGLIGQPAIDAMNRFIDDVGRHGNTHMTDEEEARFLDALRAAAARLLHSTPGQIAIMSGASELLGQMPFILPLGPRSNVLAVSTDFPAITRPWLRLANQGACRVQFVDESPRTDLTDDLVKRMDTATAVVTVGSVQYASGSVVDIARLREATESVGATLIIDATQEAGAMNRPIGSWEADVVVTSGYKWLGGHGGVAVGVIGPRLLEKTPALPGWMSAPIPFQFEATHLQLAPDARRYTQSTISYASAAGLTAAIGQLLDAGLDVIEESAHRLSALLVEGLASHGWRPRRPVGDPSASPHILALSSDDSKIEGVISRLRGAGIVVSGRGGALRVSLAAYNTEEDLDRLVGALSRS